MVVDGYNGMIVRDFGCEGRWEGLDGWMVGWL